MLIRTRKRRTRQRRQAQNVPRYRLRGIQIPVEIVLVRLQEVQKRESPNTFALQQDLFRFVSFIRCAAAREVHRANPIPLARGRREPPLTLIGVCIQVQYDVCEELSLGRVAPTTADERGGGEKHRVAHRTGGVGHFRDSGYQLWREVVDGHSEQVLVGAEALQPVRAVGHRLGSAAAPSPCRQKICSAAVARRPPS